VDKRLIQWGSSLIDQLVFFLEGPSEQDFLEGLLPKILPDRVRVFYQIFQGKQDLDRQLIRRMKGWLHPDTGFVVIRDQDSGDCFAIKAQLRALCAAAGKPNAVVRIACRELESFFVGDWPAVAIAYDKPSLAALGGKKKYRTPDLLGSPSHEIKVHVPEFQKRAGARRISPHLGLTANRSKSFNALVAAVERLVAQ
jgi:hypothetical protein